MELITLKGTFLAYPSGVVACIPLQYVQGRVKVYSA